MMELVICTPQGIAEQTDISKISFETINGYHTLLPHHVDYVSALSAGITNYVTKDGIEKYMACHQGIVVKKGKKVTFSVQGSVFASNLPELKRLIAVEFKQNEEQRKQLNTAMARLEIGLVRGFQQLKGAINGGI